jgi:hypothetical protein
LDIKIIKGNCEHLKDCEEALMKSSLGEHYFQSKGSAHKAIEEGLEQGNLFVAVAKMYALDFCSILQMVHFIVSLICILLPLKKNIEANK